MPTPITGKTEVTPVPAGGRVSGDSGVGSPVVNYPIDAVSEAVNTYIFEHHKAYLNMYSPDPLVVPPPTVIDEWLVFGALTLNPLSAPHNITYDGDGGLFTATIQKAGEYRIASAAGGNTSHGQQGATWEFSAQIIRALGGTEQIMGLVITRTLPGSDDSAVRFSGETQVTLQVGDKVQFIGRNRTNTLGASFIGVQSTLEKIGELQSA